MSKRSKAGRGKSEAVLKRTLADACRILAMAGQGDDVWGHATARVPGTETFWMKPAAIGLEEVSPDDLLLVDIDGKVLRGRRPRHSEVFIHSEIMRARPEVGAVAAPDHPRGLQLRPARRPALHRDQRPDRDARAGPGGRARDR